MGRIYVCVGRYAGTPYTIKKAWVHVSCVEELCFYICNNAYLIEDDFFAPDLLNWLEEECNLTSLAKKLRTIARQGAKLDDMVRTLLSEVHYCRDTELEEVVKLLLSNDKISPYEKCKIRADYFLKNKKYVLAQKLYEELKVSLAEELEKSEKSPLARESHIREIREQLAQVFHNLGVIYANLFLLDEAAVYFKEAYGVSGKDAHLEAYLSVCRMQMKDNEYLKFIADIPGAYEASKQVEETLKNTLEKWNVSEEKIRANGFEHMFKEGKAEGDLKDLDLAAKQQALVYKEAYRNHMGD